jgi:primosomal protein N' (replication factor Y) (superfamily II helicase)
MSELFADVAVPAPFYPWQTLFTYKIPELLEGTLTNGMLVRLNFGRRDTWGVVCCQHSTPPDAKIRVKELGTLVLAHPALSPQRLRFLEKIAEHYLHPLGLVIEAALPAPIRTGTPRTLAYEFPTSPCSVTVSASDKVLNEEQSAAHKSILESPEGAHLLWGVTGSGKTEVYLRVIEDVLARGQSALILVPEIALTPLLTERFESRFPDQVATFHSAQSPKKLREAWFDVWTGRKRIALGARSALFAPLDNLGVIVVDEEHDGSYKQEEGFRYHARDAALMLAEIYGCRCVLGSATPSAESLEATTAGRARLHRLSDRAVKGAKLPALTLIDLKKSLPVQSKIPHVEIRDEHTPPTHPGDFFLSPELRESLTKTLAKKEQAILFINRRGVGSQKLCSGCGHTLDCPNCAVKLTPHLDRMVCHYCGYSSFEPAKCPQCQREESYIDVGIGTEGIEEVMGFHFPEARVLRLDRDTVQNKDDLSDILDRFGRHEADVLVGTQMVAKGHDFPNVTLVGVLLADLGLSVPDFRASERGLQLLMQVAGRAGRALQPGQVIVQSFQPEHPVFQALAQSSGLTAYKDFLGEELAKRKLLHYPPFASLALIRFDGLEEKLVEQAAQNAARALFRLQAPGLQVLGPTDSPLSKLRGRYRKQVLIKSPDESVFRKSLEWLLQGWSKGQLEKRFKTRMLIDVDPVQML